MPETAPTHPDFAGAVDLLLQESYLAAPSELVDAVAAAARLLGATETVVYLVDYEQTQLVPVPTATCAPRGALRVDATVAGRAFRASSPTWSGTGPQRRLWVPLLDGVERFGVAEMVLGVEGDEGLVRACTQFAHLATELVVSASACSDHFERLRRVKPMGLAAELQWALLPPLTFSTHRVVVSGLLAPAYHVGGDLFDYAVDDDVAHAAILDAMGHGLQASQLAALAVGAYRNARRAGHDLQATALIVDQVLVEQYGGERFVTGLLTQLDTCTGRFRWVSAGHPAPLLLRGGKVVRALDADGAPPLGMLELAGGAPPPVQEEQLQPGDRLLLFTDGVEEARTQDGAFFGVRRLAEFVAKEAASGQPTPEIVRRLHQSVLEHHAGRLQDDATTLVVEWLTGTPGQLRPV